jgi:hypothetical protein
MRRVCAGNASFVSYASDPGNERVQKFAPDGRLLARWKQAAPNSIDGTGLRRYHEPRTRGLIDPQLSLLLNYEHEPYRIIM